MDVCGPFTLEDLDQFGDLDSLAFSLDSEVWESADTCILFSSASVNGIGSIIAAGNGIFVSSASVTGSGAATSNVIRIRTDSASVSGTGTALGESIRVRLTSASITGTGAVTALGGVEYSADGQAIGIASTEGIAFAILDGQGSVVGMALVNAEATILGEEWAIVPVSDEVWTTISQGGEVWLPVAEGTNTWLRNG